MVAQVVVYGPSGEQVTIDAVQNGKEMPQMSVLQLKGKIAEKLLGPSGPTLSNMKLIFKDQRLDDDSKLLPDYGIGHKCAIQMVISLDGGMAD